MAKSLSSDMEDVHELEMLEYIKSAIHYLELAMNVVECDDNSSNGQSEKLNNMYEACKKSRENLVDD